MGPLTVVPVQVQLQVQGAIFLAAAAVCNAAISRVVVEQGNATPKSYIPCNNRRLPFYITSTLAGVSYISGDAILVAAEEERHVRDILEIEALLDDNINMLVAQEEKYEEAMSQDNEHIDESRSQSSQVGLLPMHTGELYHY